MEEVKKDVFWYIEMFYNRKRCHSTLKYMTPIEYLRKYDEIGVSIKYRRARRMPGPFLWKLGGTGSREGTARRREKAS